MPVASQTATCPVDVERRGTAISNCFSVDVEGFVESNIESFAIPREHIDQNREDREIDWNVRVILELLENEQVHGTFFVLGRIARDIPDVVRMIAQCGHEIACHSFYHRRIFGQTPEVFRSLLSKAKCRLEDVSGQRVDGFRAPDFSITNDSRWAFDIIREAGFTYDSSVYSIGMHDVYGMADAPSHIHEMSNGLIEFPLATVEVLGKRLPYGGGGYFRLFPLWLTRSLMRAQNSEGKPCMFYIHPYEVGPVIPRINSISHYRRFRHYFNCGSGDRIVSLLKTLRFQPIRDCLVGQGFPLS